MADIPLKIIWDRLRRFFSFGRLKRRKFDLDQELLTSLQELAEREHRSPEEVASELLSSVLEQEMASLSFEQRWETLTPREQQIATLAGRGLSNAEIAAELYLSPMTVKTHMRNLLKKLGLNSKFELRLRLVSSRRGRGL